MALILRRKDKDGAESQKICLEIESGQNKFFYYYLVKHFHNIRNHARIAVSA